MTLKIVRAVNPPAPATSRGRGPQEQPRCPSCDRAMSWREYNEQGACNDCNGGAWSGGDS